MRGVYSFPRFLGKLVSFFPHVKERQREWREERGTVRKRGRSGHSVDMVVRETHMRYDSGITVVRKKGEREKVHTNKGEERERRNLRKREEKMQAKRKARGEREEDFDISPCFFREWKGPIEKGTHSTALLLLSLWVASSLSPEQHLLQGDGSEEHLQPFLHCPLSFSSRSLLQKQKLHSSHSGSSRPDTRFLLTVNASFPASSSFYIYHSYHGYNNWTSLTFTSTTHKSI